ncbi:N-acetylmuramic acid 6-phosphate phosphatase [Moorella thermoacetica]|uniref:HAD family hydrolase n=1 Tax=Neomoorella thermoacetica TaxID=1525 RepID=UPI0008FA3B1E|nr:HAD family hydrolase [Moorella thermoacetica]OIQ10461.1 phosphoglycolate phosphatase [Moorella thermoacetica]
MPALKCGNQIIECEGIIFDKDGTLIDSFKIWPALIKNRVKILQREIGFDKEMVQLLEKAMGLKEGDVIRRSPIVVGSREQTAAAMATLLFVYCGIPWDVGMEKANMALDLCDKEMGLVSQAIPISGVPKTLKNLYEAGFKLAVATNDDMERTHALMKYAGLAPYIHAYACRNEVERSKPAPDLIYLICRRLGLEAGQCIMVGDSLLDIQMGINAGVYMTVGVLTGASRKEEIDGISDMIIQDISGMQPGF